MFPLLLVRPGSCRVGNPPCCMYVSKGYVRKIIIVNDYFSDWYVYSVLNWCEIERERKTLLRRSE